MRLDLARDESGFFTLPRPVAIPYHRQLADSLPKACNPVESNSVDDERSVPSRTKVDADSSRVLTDSQPFQRITL